MTTTTLILINIAFILGITLAFIFGRKSSQSKKKVKKNGKKRAKKTRKAKAKVTHGDAETPSKKAVSDQKKGRKRGEAIAKKIWKMDPNAIDAETLKAYSEAIAYQDAMNAENTLTPSYDQANVGAQPELNLDPDEYLKNMQKMTGAK